MERFHAIGVECVNCQSMKTKVTEVGLSCSFKIAVNYKCGECGVNATKIDDVCLLVAECRVQEGVLLT